MSIPQEVETTLGEAGIRNAADVPESTEGFLVEDDGGGDAIVRWHGARPEQQGQRLAECQSVLDRAGFQVEQVGFGPQPGSSAPTAEQYLRVTRSG